MAPSVDRFETESLVLWNIIEVHFDELEFALEQFERGLEDPMHTLCDLARFPEPAIDAHVDGLVVGGDEVREQLLVPALLEASPDALTKPVAAALVIIASNRYELLWSAIQHPNPGVRRAVARAAAYAPQPGLDAWFSDKLTRRQDPPALAGLLELCAARRMAPPDLAPLLTSADPGLVATAARAALYAEPGRYLPIVERLLEHDASEVRNAALIAALAWRSNPGWKHCERAALEQSQPEAAALYAALGGRKHHERLRARLADEANRPAVLFGLGFSGNASIVADLLPYVRSKRQLEVKTAAQSISLITGLDLDAKEYQVDRPSPEVGELPAPEDDPEALESLPPLAQDDLDADLVPQPEELIPELDIRAIERHCRTTLLDPGRRWLGGEPFHAESLLDHLEHAPLRSHHVFARALGIMTGGEAWFDSRACTRLQLAQLASLRARGLASVLRTYRAW